MKKSVLLFFKIIIGICLIIYVCYSADLFSSEGRNKLLATFKEADLFWLVVAIIYIPFIDFVSTLKWHYLSRKMLFQVSLWRLFIFYIVGRFFNLILPSSIGGDLIRIHLLARNDRRYAEAAAVVFVERLTGVVALVAIALIAAYLSFKTSELQYLNAAFLVALVGVGGILFFVFTDTPLIFIQKRFASNYRIFEKILEKALKFKNAVNYFRRNNSVIVLAFFYSLLFYFFACINVWVTSLVFQSDISLQTMLYSVPIIMFIMNIPLSIGGLGIMEFGYVFTLSLFGISPEVALSIALLMRIKTIIAAIFGAGFYPIVSNWGISLEELGKQKKQSKENFISSNIYPK